ncbi:uncharacterized protein FSUBG_6167 [Fusarium subglutinans]|uniref:DUF6603 domain-containing protein n=1 Tax=Gibberella subglutinans TaxID=42677 RepID=A0A8H5V1W0_GIBSU|nr:uncharacterized protein FSUBG_6167 [Fusarium subglutinans]KAF5606333.1 hypothetical protein FSUBG_6167 [Fusarium subglutinans]
MRIGQGFNSYTHEICIKGAVAVETDGEHKESTQTRTIEGPSQVVSYSARAVEKLSDIIQTMNVSYPHSIKKGNVTVSGSNSAIDEALFKSADLNIIVTVKVTNQTTLIKNNARFVPMKGIDPSSQAFNEAYGDSYISGFIKGGEFTGIISIKVIDRSNVDLTVKKIKARLDAKESSKPTEFILNSSDSFSSRGTASVMENTESHIHVSWMGGGQIKNENTPWDIDSIFKAAAAFPQRVSERPQLTWAILTKYKSNRSFLEWANNKPVKTLEYDQVSSYTAELFDSYMDYKILLKYVQLTIDDPDNYQASGDQDSLDTSIETLLGIRSAMRKEQSKIIEAISILSRDPGILSRQGGWGNTQANKVVNRILGRVAGHSATRSDPTDPKDPTPGHEHFDFSALIPAEVWRKWMPVRKPTSSTSSTSKKAITSTSSTDVISGIRPPPSDDQNWHGSSQTGESGNSNSNYVSVLQAKLNAVTRDLEAKTEEHVKLKSDRASELEALKTKHNEDLENINKKHADYNTLRQEQHNEVEERLRRLEKKKLDAVNAVKSEEQQKYASLQKKHEDLSVQLQSFCADITERMQSDKKAALEKLEKEKDAAYNALRGNYESLKKQLSDLTAEESTLTTDSEALKRLNASLTAELSEKKTDYNTLKAEYDSLENQKTSWVADKAKLEKEKNGLETDNGDAKGRISKMTDILKWAGLAEESRLDNCLPYSYSGWTVMIMMPHSRMALNANNDNYSKAHAWAFDMHNEDEIFQLEKADDKPTTPWTIKHKATGNLLVFLNGEVDWQVRCRRKGDSDIHDKAAHWFIGRGSADSNTTWVLRNAQWSNLCIELVHGWAENGRCATTVHVFLRTNPLADPDFAGPTQILGTIDYSAAGWTLTESISNLWASALYQFFDASIQSAIAPVIQSIILSGDQAGGDSGDSSEGTDSGMAAYQKTVGGLSVRNIGLSYSKSILSIKLDASISLGPVAFSLLGTCIQVDFSKDGGTLSNINIDMISFSIDGMAAAFDRPPLLMAGAFEALNKPGVHGYQGGVSIAYKPWMFAAAGFYGTMSDLSYTTAFVYVLLTGPLVTLEFTQLTGITGGFGYNTNLRAPSAAAVPQIPFITPPPSTGSPQDDLAKPTGTG